MSVRKVMFFLVLFMSILSTKIFAEGEENLQIQEPEFADAKVLSVISDIKNVQDTSAGPYEIRVQTLKVKILSGKYKGELKEVENNIDATLAQNIILKKGDNIILSVNEFDGDVHFNVSDMKRDNYVYYMLGIFALLVIIVGRFKGFKSLVTLAITLYAIIGILLPLIIKGKDPILLSIIIGIVVTFITIFIVAGINKKALSAVIGTSVGVIIAGIIALIIGYLAHLSGLGTSEAQMLMNIPQKTNFNYQGLLFASILLGTLGAVMDVAISIASSITEVYEANPLKSIKELFISGMNIGKDVMGTMTNTLILAYVGSSMPLLLLLSAYQRPIKDIINMDIIATEIIRSVTGTIGLISCIPITAIISALLCKKVLKKSKTQESTL